MKSLLKILLGGFLAFMVLAVAQEWQYFASAWFGAPVEEPAMTESEEKVAADTLYLMLNLMRHFYASDGDPRFSERMPASPAVLDEIRADVEYLRRNQRRQDLSLERLEVTAMEALGPERVEIRTRERWKIRILWAADGAESEPARSQTIHGKYLLARQGQTWQVAGWDAIESDAGTEGSVAGTD